MKYVRKHGQGFYRFHETLDVIGRLGIEIGSSMEVSFDEFPKGTVGGEEDLSPSLGSEVITSCVARFTGKILEDSLGASRY